MRILYCIYQLFIALPVTVLITIITAIEVGVGCALGDGHFGVTILAAGGHASLHAFSYCLFVSRVVNTWNLTSLMSSSPTIREPSTSSSYTVFWGVTSSG